MVSDKFDLHLNYDLLSSGDIVYSYALGQHVIILNSLKMAIDLFEKRSQMYSDRPVIPMRDMYVFLSPSLQLGNDFLTSNFWYSLGWDFVLGLMFYGDAWRNNRRTLHRKYRPDAALAYRPTQMKKIHELELLRNLLIDPTEFIDHYKQCVVVTGSTCLCILTYAVEQYGSFGHYGHGVWI